MNHSVSTLMDIQSSLAASGAHSDAIPSLQRGDRVTQFWMQGFKMQKFAPRKKGRGLKIGDARIEGLKIPPELGWA